MLQIIWRGWRFFGFSCRPCHGYEIMGLRLLRVINFGPIRIEVWENMPA